MNASNESSFISANLSNNSSSTPIASVPIRIFGAISYALLSFISVLLNLLLITVLTHGHSQFRRLPFFTLAWQMIVCDLMTQAVQLIVAVPVTFAGKPVYGHPFWYYALLFCDTFAYNATLHFSGLLTLSRLCIFFWPRLNQLLFSPNNISVTISVLWIYLIGYCACWNLVGCRKAFSETGFYMFHECPEQLSPRGILFRQISFTMSTYLPVIMLIAYIFCFIYIRYFFCPNRSNQIRSASIRSIVSKDREEQRIEKRRRQREKNFLIQISILLNTISPVILFVFNRDVRKCLVQLLPSSFHSNNIAPSMRIGHPVPAITNSLTISPSQLMNPQHNHQHRKSHLSISFSTSRPSQPQNQLQHSTSTGGTNTKYQANWEFRHI